MVFGSVPWGGAWPPPDFVGADDWSLAGNWAGGWGTIYRGQRAKAGPPSCTLALARAMLRWTSSRSSSVQASLGGDRLPSCVW